MEGAFDVVWTSVEYKTSESHGFQPSPDEIFFSLQYDCTARLHFYLNLPHDSIKLVLSHTCESFLISAPNYYSSPSFQ